MYIDRRGCQNAEMEADCEWSVMVPNYGCGQGAAFAGNVNNS